MAQPIKTHNLKNKSCGIRFKATKPLNRNVFMHRNKHKLLPKS